MTSMLPSHADDMARRGSLAIGGVWGRYAGVAPRAWWTPVRVLLALTCLTLLLGFTEKSTCSTGDFNTKRYTHMCYSDILPLWGDERLDVGAVPYRDTAVEYPVLTGGFMWLSADLTRAVHRFDEKWSAAVVFVSVSSLLLAACGLLVTLATAGAARRRPYDAAIFALSPLLVFHAFSNWDLLAMAFTSGALWAWARRRPVLAGALIGLGTAAKLYPILLLVPLAILAYRTGKWASVRWATGSAVLTWSAVNVPVALAYHHGWWKFYDFSFHREAERSSVWAIVKTLADSGANATDAVAWQPSGLAVGLLLFAALGAVAWIGLRAPAKPRLAQLSFLVVLAFLLTTKVWSPQYSLWLVPLLALARPRWRLALIWQFTEIAVWMVTLTLLLGLSPGQDAHGIGYGWLILVLIARDLLLLALAGLIVRDMWRPELDVVRADGSDDPGGGVFDEAEDRLAAAPRLAVFASRNSD